MRDILYDLAIDKIRFACFAIFMIWWLAGKVRCRRAGAVFFSLTENTEIH